MARCLVLDAVECKLYEKDCVELQDFYDAIGCYAFDIANRDIGGRRFDIFVDDIGLFADNPIVSAIDIGREPMLVGNLVFANHDSEGNTTDLTDDDIEHIKSNVVHYLTLNGRKGIAVECAY